MQPSSAANPDVPSDGLPFIVGRPLHADEPIFGRDAAFRSIHTALASYSSVNLIGERRMGKTSLLTYLCENPNYAPPAPAGRRPLALAFLDLQNDISGTARFYGKSVRAWLAPLNLGQGQGTRALRDMKRRLATRPELDEDGFDRALNLLADPQGANVRPVLVLDEFERLLELADRGQLPFPDFFNNMRARMTAERLAMVVASRQPLSKYFNDPRRPGTLTSTFPSYFQPFMLRELDDAAADALLLQPSAYPLTLAEVTEARRWAKDHPCRLQVAGAAMYEAKRDRRNAAWVRVRREELARQACTAAPAPVPATTAPAAPTARAQPILRMIFWSGPLWVGRLVQKLGVKLDEMVAWTIGVVIIVLVILLILGYVPGQDLRDFLRRIFGVGG